MKRAISRFVVAAGLVGLGWVAGTAQVSEPDFELIVDAPVGKTSIQCVRGCELMWVERGINPNNSPMSTFWFGCEGLVTRNRCSSSNIGGWIKH